ncbi:Alcohol dehydrogenase transcription factor Myb/SANT-like [Popillia japonica]|uniref:Alcohol dehydrogenase transcription factor Myb/SANT-like n=1 Tax=Popillia japonica TaxID=7064 RepID=A0AAW1ME68_POPJA
MASFTWTKEETAELITVYEENSILWDTKNVEYRNREKKNKIFLEIAKKFNCSADEIQRKLHNLRNQVSRELKKIRKKKSGDGTDDNYISNWPYFKALQFLVPVLTLNKTQSLMVTVTSLNSSQSTEAIMNEVGTELEGQTPNEAAMSPNETNRKRRKTTQRSKKDFEEDEIYKKALETLRKEPDVDDQKEPDVDDQFGQYVAMELKGLRSAYNKQKLKSEIRKIVTRIIDEDDMYYYASSSSTPTPIPSPGYLVQSLAESSQTLPSAMQQFHSDEGESPASCRQYINSFKCL